MRFVPFEQIEGPVVVEVEEHRDDRGFFARSFCVDEFTAAGLDPAVVQCNISYNSRAGTVRGMHAQREPAAEVKLVRVTRGAVLDTIVDVRPDSPTYLQHVSAELTADNRRALYVPKGFAHGFITLADDTEVFYQMSARYAPGTDYGLRHDDPALGITWPVPVRVISERDANWPLLQQR